MHVPRCGRGGADRYPGTACRRARGGADGTLHPARLGAHARLGLERRRSVERDPHFLDVDRCCLGGRRVLPPNESVAPAMTNPTCAEAVMRLLAAYGVDTVFGMAGTMTVELYRGMALAGIRHVQCRNEQGASLMADGYARATGKPGVCTIIAGPGVTNAATGIAQAYCDSQPMLVLSGGCATNTHGKGWGEIHELDDQAAVTAGFTAFSAMIRYPEEVPELVARAYSIFRSSRARPVHLSLPRDVLPLA